MKYQYVTAGPEAGLPAETPIAEVQLLGEVTADTFHNLLRSGRLAIKSPPRRPARKTKKTTPDAGTATEGGKGRK